MSELLEELKSRLQNGFWHVEKYVVDKTWGNIDTITSEFNGVFDAVANTENTSGLASLDRVKESVELVRSSTSDPLTVGEHILTSLQALQSLHGINGAYNSRKYPDASSLTSKGESYILRSPLSHRNNQIHNEFFIQTNIPEIVNNYSLTWVPELIGGTVNELGRTIYPSLQLPTTHVQTVHYISKLSKILLEWTGFSSAPLASAVSYWISGTVLKSLGMGGSIAARYLAAGGLKAIAPASSTLPFLTAWNTLIPFAPYAIAVAILITVLIKLKYEEDVTILSQFVVFFGSSMGRGMKCEIGGFPTDKDDFLEAVGELMEDYTVAFGLEGGLPVVGVDSNGNKLEQTELLTLFQTHAQLHNVVASSGIITKLQPTLIDLG